MIWYVRTQMMIISSTKMYAALLLRRPWEPKYPIYMYSCKLMCAACACVAPIKALDELLLCGALSNARRAHENTYAGPCNRFLFFLFALFCDFCIFFCNALEESRPRWGSDKHRLWCRCGIQIFSCFFDFLCVYPLPSSYHRHCGPRGAV